MIPIPVRYIIPDSLHYPEDNTEDFEYYFYKQYKEEENKSGRIYLGVLFTAFYKRFSFGKNPIAVKDLQVFIDSLDKTKKYFTICQYDDGILNDLSGFDIKVFSMSGDPMDYPLPLICQPHKYEFPNVKDIFCSFVGRNTHPIRQTIINKFKGKNGYFISTANHSMRDYCEIIARSTFTLCPRGYGPSSFRIMEAVQYQSIPVYISDNHIKSNGNAFWDYGVQTWFHGVDSLDSTLKSITPEAMKIKYEYLKTAFNEYYTYEATRRLILNTLNES